MGMVMMIKMYWQLYSEFKQLELPSPNVRGCFIDIERGIELTRSYVTAELYSVKKD